MACAWHDQLASAVTSNMSLDAMQVMALGSVAAASKLFMQGLTRTTIEGRAALTAAQVSCYHGHQTPHGSSANFWLRLVAGLWATSCRA